MPPPPTPIPTVPSRMTTKQKKVFTAQPLGIDTAGTTEVQLSEAIRTANANKKKQDSTHSPVAAVKDSGKRKRSGKNTGLQPTKRPKTAGAQAVEGEEDDDTESAEPDLGIASGTAVPSAQISVVALSLLPNASSIKNLDFLAQQNSSDKYDAFMQEWHAPQDEIPAEDLEDLDDNDRAALQQEQREAAIEPYPITGPKAYWFVQFERNRRELGKQTVSQMISALEWRRIQSSYLNSESEDPLVDRKLWEKGPIKALETLARREEKQRKNGSQPLKVEGSSISVMTEDEMKRCSSHLLRNQDVGIAQKHKNARSRAMLLISAQSGFRGASTRALKWSDVRRSEVPVVELGVNEDGISTVPALTFYTDEAKHNQDGEVQEYHMFRHRRNPFHHVTRYSYTPAPPGQDAVTPTQEEAVRTNASTPVASYQAADCMEEPNSEDEREYKRMAKHEIYMDGLKYGCLRLWWMIVGSRQRFRPVLGLPVLPRTTTESGADR
ncbi:hypothetical protein QFC24_005326 [Naganishia onofrii]|uniref:Uncharacterized protein n=1 Tax=Naganishia onofrii TaxID=1851511 RepID=A0ACC2X8I4_9TREE|nr:hypothetical protein QFC24_005326 [Naganishia onofrii]